MNSLLPLKISSSGQSRWGAFFDIEGKGKELERLEQEMNDPGFWFDRARAAAKARRADFLRNEIESQQHLADEARDYLELARADERERDVNLATELWEKEKELTRALETLEFNAFMDGAYDHRNAIVTIYAGSGGTEAMDWAAMLERMILKYCGSRGFTATVMDRTPGEIAGIKNATIEVEGRYCYGWLKGESGVHRLVRISPFDAEQMRHTSFAMIEVLPEFEDIDDVQIDPKELRIDTFLSSGHGGQSVQTTYSAVRIVHIPSGIAVSCQKERSQLQNKETAMKILKSRLLQKKRAEQRQERQELRGEVVSPEWGNQIRSYVLHPYKLVKDHRTGYETTEPDRALEGELLPFEEAYLRWLKQGGKEVKR